MVIYVKIIEETATIQHFYLVAIGFKCVLQC